MGAARLLFVHPTKNQKGIRDLLPMRKIFACPGSSLAQKSRQRGAGTSQARRFVRFRADKVVCKRVSGSKISERGDLKGDSETAPGSEFHSGKKHSGGCKKPYCRKPLRLIGGQTNIRHKPRRAGYDILRFIRARTGKPGCVQSIW